MNDNPMKPFAIVHENAPVILVGAGQLYPNDLSDSLTFGKIIVAADGGAEAVLAAGYMPDAIIGDMDSQPSDKRLEGLIHHIPEQDSTDFDKALRSISAPLILACGFTGKRIDHSLAVLTALMTAQEQLCVVVGEESVIALCPPRIAFDLPAGSVFSVFPMQNTSATSTGLKWPLEGVDLGPTRRIGTSNEVSGPVEITVDDPHLIVIVPRAALAELVRALRAAPAQWPARV
jgi:thiamine pyrophosphokinase